MQFKELILSTSHQKAIVSSTLSMFFHDDSGGMPAKNSLCQSWLVDLAGPWKCSLRNVVTSGFVY